MLRMLQKLQVLREVHVLQSEGYVEALTEDLCTLHASLSSQAL